MKVLVAGVGNVLRGDDGFGVAVAEVLMERELPPEIQVIEVGIGGIHLVQMLLAEPVEFLIVVDTVEMGRAPGTVLVIEPVVEDVVSLPLHEKHDKLADMHYSTPDRALMLANAMGSLPEKVWVVGCEPIDADTPGEGLSPPVARAVHIAVDEIEKLSSAAGVRW